uniref:breast carcinoma-amplified sequence 4 isoform X6 n=1 Tax=Podarcis muralis TaxID=64176 RepID=UPI00109FE555|nr:breast carcinoma-amplified sequence 4 isoform X6 [Podarcis muralis]
MRGAAAAALPLWAGGATVPRRRRQGAPRARPAAPGKREPLRIRPTALGCGGVPEPGPEKPLPAASGPSRLPATAMSAAAASERGEASASSTTLSPSAEAGGGHGEPQLRAEEAAAEEEEREARQFALYLAPEAGREGREEAFVKMAGHHVSFLEEQVLEAEKAHAIFPYTVQKLFGSVATPSFKKLFGLMKHVAKPVIYPENRSPFAYLCYSHQGGGFNLPSPD